MPEGKKTKPPWPETAAEQDARAMLLAGGIRSATDGESAMQRLIGDLPRTQRMLITFEEFRAMVPISKATFHRLLRSGKGPKVITIMGAVKRIHIDTATEWIAALREAESEDPEPQPEVKLPERKPRAVKTPAAPLVRRLYEPPLGKRARPIKTEPQPEGETE